MDRKQRFRQFVGPALVVAVLGGLIWFQSARQTAYYNSGFRQVMGTITQMTVAAHNEREAQGYFNAAFAEMDEINRTMNDWDPNSEISQLSMTAHKEPVPVSPKLFEILSISLEYSRLSDGAFDITVGPETQLWRQMRKTGLPPDPNALSSARSKVGYEKITLDPAAQTVHFAVEGMKLDVGAIGKGFAVDKAVETLRKKGASAGMVDLGGNIRCFGPGPAAGHWYIGLRNPRQPDTILIKLRLDEMAVATSGDYEQYAEVNGTKQSHILNPKTAESVKELASVTILAASATVTDALSTTISVLGKDKGLALLKQLGIAEAILTTSEQPETLIQTDGAKQYLETN